MNEMNSRNMIPGAYAFDPADDCEQDVIGGDELKCAPGGELVRICLVCSGKAES